MQIYVIYVLKEVLDIHILINYNSFMNFVDLFLHIFYFFSILLMYILKF